MATYSNMSKDALKDLYADLERDYKKVLDEKLSLNMARGLPEEKQLDISNEMLSILTDSKDCICEEGFDVRQYGHLTGIKEAARVFEYMCNADIENVIVCGASSLNVMYDTMTSALLYGTSKESTPWIRQGNIKFICVVPGYDRHFAICESLGIEMINVDILPTGPDMDKVEELVKDPSVKGMWCVPKFSNPTGYVYSNETIERICKLKPAAKDFRIFWDNAYAVHDFKGRIDFPNILDLIKGTENEDMVYMFASTSKITHPGSGISAFISSKNNAKWFEENLKYRIISYDKTNMLRHAKYINSKEKLFEIMDKHAEIVRPKFEKVNEIFSNELGECDIAKWTNPTGGYFISLDVMEGTAQRVYTLCKDAGLTLTKVGATFPYSKDPKDMNLRIAPTFPSIKNLEKASEIICLCVKIAAIEKILNK